MVTAPPVACWISSDMAGTSTGRARRTITFLILGLATFVAPRTSNWSGSRDAINEYIQEQNSNHRQSLRLDDLVTMAQQELSPKSSD